ncbi:MAG UNVERIFIED_CONTAM: hypothetical protein LOD86_15935, partial [Thermobifida fusca]
MASSDRSGKSRALRSRGATLAALAEAVRQVTARGVLYHHALAERLGLNASDLQCLTVLQETGPIPA